jgi:hypothetical protein
MGVGRWIRVVVSLARGRKMEGLRKRKREGDTFFGSIRERLMKVSGKCKIGCSMSQTLTNTHLLPHLRPMHNRT